MVATVSLRCADRASALFPSLLTALPFPSLLTALPISPGVPTARLPPVCRPRVSPGVPTARLPRRADRASPLAANRVLQLETRAPPPRPLHPFPLPLPASPPHADPPRLSASRRPSSPLRLTQHPPRLSASRRPSPPLRLTSTLLASPPHASR
ncbi:hypothetical protein EV715DRAFT_297315 [Schizophyllum commune]